MKDTQLAGIGGIGTLASVILDNIAKTGPVLSVICAGCTLIVILPRTLRTVRNFMKGEFFKDEQK